VAVSLDCWRGEGAPADISEAHPIDTSSSLYKVSRLQVNLLQLLTCIFHFLHLKLNHQTPQVAIIAKARRNHLATKIKVSRPQASAAVGPDSYND
jgi:hypothetical protein